MTTVDLIQITPPISLPFQINPLNFSQNLFNYYYYNTLLTNTSGGIKENVTILFVPQKVPLNKEVFVCTILAVAFSILYIYLSNLDNQRPYLQNTKDDEYICEQDFAHSLENIRLIFWAFLYMQYFVVFSALNILVTMEGKYLYVTLKVIIVWLLCRTGREKKSGFFLVCTGLAYIYLLWIFAICFHNASQLYRKRLIVFTVETLLDAILVLGHCWDAQAPIITVLNCRLFYTAVGCSLAQSLILI